MDRSPTRWCAPEFPQPFSSTTPMARPFSTRILFTAASVRTITPALAAEAAIAATISPIPPLGTSLRAGSAADLAGETIIETEQRGRRARPEMAAEHRVEGEQDLSAGRRSVARRAGRRRSSGGRAGNRACPPCRAFSAPAPTGRAQRSRTTTCRRGLAAGGRGTASRCRHSGRAARAIACHAACSDCGRADEAFAIGAGQRQRAILSRQSNGRNGIRAARSSDRAFPVRARSRPPGAAGSGHARSTRRESPARIPRCGQRPPSSDAASSTSTLRPLFASIAAQTRPLWPPPMTMTSMWSWVPPICWIQMTSWAGLICLVARERSRRISAAALRPGAPMTPPPGWVEEPHI